MNRGFFAQPRFAVVDVETTGLSASTHRVLEVAVITTDSHGQILDEWATRVNPQGPVGATHIHGITAADVAHAPTFDQLVDDLNLRLSGAAVCAHNARFDLAFLRAEYARAGWRMPFVPALCTLEASSYHLPHLERRRLADCCWAVGRPLTSAHSALGDARATAGLLAAFMDPRLGVPPRASDVSMLEEAYRVAWPTQRSATPVAIPSTGRRLSDQAFRNIAAHTAPMPSKPLVELVERFSLADALGEGAPVGTIAYLEKVAEVLEDGILTAQEALDLREVADIQELDDDAVTAAHRAFVLALALEAVADGKVTRAEKAELLSVAELLEVGTAAVARLLDRAEDARHDRLGASLKALPSDWTLGDPLRVGDRVVFTGCDPALRQQLEEQSAEAGVRVMNNVASTTAMLVTDGTMDGTKLERARELRTRIVSPEDYRMLVEHIQPAVRHKAKTATRTIPAPAAGTRVDPGPAGSVNAVAATDAAAAAGIVTTAVTPAVIRTWARANGWEVGVRGRLPAPLLEAYAAAHPDDSHSAGADDAPAASPDPLADPLPEQS